MPQKLFAKDEAFYKATQAAPAEVLLPFGSIWLANSSWCREINL